MVRRVARTTATRSVPRRGHRRHGQRGTPRHGGDEPLEQRERLLATVAGWFTFLYNAPAQGADGPLRLATAPALEGATGGYFNKTQPQAPAKAARDDETTRRLWEISEKVVARVAGEAA